MKSIFCFFTLEPPLNGNDFLAVKRAACPKEWKIMQHNPIFIVKGGAVTDYTKGFQRMQIFE